MELLSDLLIELRDEDFDLTLTGFDTIPGDITNPLDEYTGMPEYSAEDQTAFRDIVIHFKDEASLREFADLIKQPITEKTRFLWYPEQPTAALSSVKYE